MGLHTHNRSTYQQIYNVQRIQADEEIPLRSKRNKLLAPIKLESPANFIRFETN